MRLKMRFGNEDFYSLKRFELSPMGHGEPWKQFKHKPSNPKISPVPVLAVLIFCFYIESFGCFQKEKKKSLMARWSARREREQLDGSFYELYSCLTNVLYT